MHINTEFKLRLANLKDIYLYYEWVNEKAVRKNSFNSQKINFNDHKEWFVDQLKSNEAFLFILEKFNEPIAQIRFNIIQDIAYIDYSVNFNYRGQGIGSELIKLGIYNLKNNYNIPIRAIVKKSNKSSIKIFNNLNFVIIKNTLDNVTFEIK